MLKSILQSPCLQDRVKTVVIDQSLINNDIYEHKCLKKIKKLYKHAGKCDNQQQFKYIIKVALVYTTGVFTNYIPISPMKSTTVKKPSARKSLCLFTNILDVKKKTATCQFGASKYKGKAIKYETSPWKLKHNRKGNSTINDKIKKSLCN